TRIGLSMAAGLLAVPFLIGGFAVLVVLCLDRSPRLARTAAVFLTFAMVGLAAVHGLELAAYGLTRSGDTAAAVSVLELEDPGLPGAVLFVTFLAGAAFGTLALVAAMWWSPLLPRVVPFLVLGFAVLDFALGFGLVAHLVNVAAAAVVAWAVVTGYSRDSRSGGTAWKIPGPRSGRAARKAADVPAEHAPPPQ
ncbi:MAG: hypothetical protein ACRDV1_16160, partial [Actinomycetes bacterium]